MLFESRKMCQRVAINKNANTIVLQHLKYIYFASLTGICVTQCWVLEVFFRRDLPFFRSLRLYWKSEQKTMIDKFSCFCHCCLVLVIIIWIWICPDALFFVCTFDNRSVARVRAIFFRICMMTLGRKWLKLSDRMNTLFRPIYTQFILLNWFLVSFLFFRPQHSHQTASFFFSCIKPNKWFSYFIFKFLSQSIDFYWEASRSDKIWDDWYGSISTSNKFSKSLKKKIAWSNMNNKSQRISNSNQLDDICRKLNSISPRCCIANLSL